MSDRLTAIMVDDCLRDPVLGAKVLLGYTVPPHMEGRLWAMWTKPFMMDSSGFGTAKSLCIAIVAAMRAILMPGRVIGICSTTFEQGQRTHKYFDDWIEKSRFFESQVKGGRHGSLHGSSVWQVKFRNGSEIRTITPDYKGGAERAGSEDWHDGLFDEFTKIPDILAFERQLKTRIRKPVQPFFEGTDPIFDRHIYQAGTAKDKTHPTYATVMRYEKKIAEGDKAYCVQSWNYHHIPENFHHLINIKMIKELEESLPRDLSKQEILGIWTDNSLSFYSKSDQDACRDAGVPVLITRESDWVYSLGVDAAQGGARRTKVGRARLEADDFAASTTRAKADGTDAQLVSQKRETALTTEQMSAIIHRLHMEFQYRIIVMDPGGGGYFVRDDLREPTQDTGAEAFPVRPIITRDDEQMMGLGEDILVLFGRSDSRIQAVVPKMKGEGFLPNKMHEVMRGALEKRNIALPEDWDGWSDAQELLNPDAKRAFLAEAMGLQGVERVRAEIDLALSQMLSVNKVLMPDLKTPKRDRDGFFEFKSRFKKDAAYSVCYSYFGLWLLREEIKMAERRPKKRGKFVHSIKEI